MSIIDREDIHEQIELAKVVDVENIPYEKLMGVLIGFVYDELYVKNCFQELSIDSKDEAIIRNYALRGKAFLNKDLTKEELTNERISAWTTHDSLIDDSSSKVLLRIIICLLYDREDAEYDVYGSGEILGVIFSLFLDLGSGYCSRLRHYLQEKLS